MDEAEDVEIPAIMRAEQIVNTVIGENPTEALYGLTLGRKIVAGRDDDLEEEPTWDEAVASFDSSEPVELVRPARIVVVDVTHDGTEWTGASEQIDGFRVSAKSREDVYAVWRAALAGWLDPAVRLEFEEKF